MPWPTVGGNRVRVYNLLRNLSARGHRITLVMQADREWEDARRELEPLVERIIILWRRRRLSPMTLLAAAFSRYPVDVSIHGFSRSMRKVMQDLLKEPWDIVQVEHSYGLQSFLSVLERLDQPFVMTEHNVESTLYTPITTTTDCRKRCYHICINSIFGDIAAGNGAPSRRPGA